MRFYSFYTDSHRVLKDEWFLPSFCDQAEMKIKHVRQDCESGTYYSPGWNATMKEKVVMLLEAITECWNEVFVYADIDIQWFGPTQARLLELLGKRDLVIQRDSPSGMACAGFFVCRANARTKKLFTRILTLMEGSSELDDQKILNDELKTRKGWTTFLSKRGLNPFFIRWEHLPSEFYSPGALKAEQWVPGQALPLPARVLVHHANWTVGVQNKIAQLRIVKEAFQSPRKETSSRLPETAKMR